MISQSLSIFKLCSLNDILKSVLLKVSLLGFPLKGTSKHYCESEAIYSDQFAKVILQ